MYGVQESRSKLKNIARKDAFPRSSETCRTKEKPKPHYIVKHNLKQWAKMSKQNVKNAMKKRHDCISMVTRATMAVNKYTENLICPSMNIVDEDVNAAAVAAAMAAAVDVAAGDVVDAGDVATAASSFEDDDSELFRRLLNQKNGIHVFKTNNASAYPLRLPM